MHRPFSAPQDRALLNREFLPWALRAGARAPDLMCIYCELHLGWKQQVRESCGQCMCIYCELHLGWCNESGRMLAVSLW